MPDLRKAVFLDRDGVLNASVVRDSQPYPPATIAEFQLLPGVAEACADLKRAGYLLVVVTNQPDVGRGTQSRESVEAMHAELLRQVALDRVEVCYDADDAAGSGRRKPAPGMILDAARELGIDPAQSFMIGDRWRDVDCGRNAGCRTIFIDCGYRETLRQPPDFIVRDLPEAARLILSIHQPPLPR